MLGGLMVLVGAGCSRTSSTSGSTAGTGSGGSTVAAGCSHPYYPLRQGYSVTFKDTFPSFRGSPGEDHYTVRVTESSADGAKVVTHFDTSGIEVSQQLRCHNGAVAATSYVDMSSARSGSQSFQAETRSVDGDYLPADLRVGSEWDTRFAIVLHPQGATASALGRDIEATVTMHHKVAGEERVTVPAGSYQALKVVSQTSVDMRGGIAAGAMPTFTTTEWWVRDVGLVKGTTSFGSGIAATTEAERVMIP